MPSILRTAIDLLRIVGKRYLNPRRHRRQHRFIQQSMENKQYRSFIHKCFPYFQVKSLQLSSWIQLWPTIQSLMINIDSDGRKLHYHWKVINSIRKLSKQSLIIKFNMIIQLNSNKLIVKFSSHWERECFLLICKKLGRIPEKPTRKIESSSSSLLSKRKNHQQRRPRPRQQRIHIKHRRKQYPVIRDLSESNENNQRDEQLKILKRFLSIGNDSNR